MSGNNSNRPGRLAKPPKPYLGFPLSPHASGHWCKRIRTKLHYFGPWAKRVNGVMERVPGDGWREALAQYERVAAELHSGRPARPDPEQVQLKDVLNAFLTLKQSRVQTGELTHLSFGKYKDCCDLLASVFGTDCVVAGLGPADFRKLRKVMTDRWASQRTRDFVQMVRGVFRYAVESRLIDRLPLYGQEFQRPSKRVMRLERAAKGSKMFERDELLAALDAAGPGLKAMLLLGICCGFGNGDVGRLRLGHLNLDTGWCVFPRPKTGISRRCWLWPEVVQAVEAWLKVRPSPKERSDADLVFLTHYGHAWHQDSKVHNALVNEVYKLLKRLKLKRPGLSFYSLRHSFATVASESRDQVAVDAIMGHIANEVTAGYRERISDARLRAVSEHVRNWLYGPSPVEEGGSHDFSRGEVNPPNPLNPLSDERPRLRLFAG
jgi:integrase